MNLAVGVTMMGRRQAEALITSSGTTGVIKRKTGFTATDPVTLEEVPTYTTIYTGVGKIRQPDGNPQAVSIPGSQVTDQRAILSLPIDAVGSGDVRTDDIWEWTANPLDVSKVGQKLRIAGVVSGTYITARRFPVEEST